MKGMFLKKSNIYYWKWATVAKKFQLSMTKLGTHDEIRWNDGICCLYGAGHMDFDGGVWRSRKLSAT